MSDLVCIGTFASRLEAEIARGLLASAGIFAVIAGDDCGGELPNLPAGGVGLLVPEDEAPEAVEVLQASATQSGPGAGDGE